MSSMIIKQQDKILYVSEAITLANNYEFIGYDRHKYWIVNLWRRLTKTRIKKYRPYIPVDQPAERTTAVSYSHTSSTTTEETTRKKYAIIDEVGSFYPHTFNSVDDSSTGSDTTSSFHYGGGSGGGAGASGSWDDSPSHSHHSHSHHDTHYSSYDSHSYSSSSYDSGSSDSSSSDSGGGYSGGGD